MSVIKVDLSDSTQACVGDTLMYMYDQQQFVE